MNSGDVCHDMNRLIRLIKSFISVSIKDAHHLPELPLGESAAENQSEPRRSISSYLTIFVPLIHL